MPSFKASQFSIREEAKGEETGKTQSSGVRVVKLDSGEKPVISEFQISPLDMAREKNYQTVKRRFGSLVATDPDRPRRTREDSRFRVNPLLREPLSIEEEEKRVIEERVRARLSVMIDEAKESAVSRGYQEGLKKGYEEAYQKFQGEGIAKIEKLEKFISEFESAKVEIFKANERFLIELVFRVARLLMLKELSADREYVLRLARELIERMGVRENITIRVNEEDFKTAAQLKEGLEKNLGTLTNLNIEVTDLVQSGGCLVETEWNAIDAAIETQLQGLYEALIGSKR